MSTQRINRRTKDLKEVLRPMVPLATLAEFNLILEKAIAGHLRHLPPSIAAWQALTAYVRHNHTEYDEMLDDGYDKDTARHFVLETMNEKLTAMGSVRLLDNEES